MAININSIVDSVQEQINLVTVDTDTIEILKLLKAASETGDEFINIASITGIVGLQDALDLKADLTDLSSHTSNTSNPHSVTKAQVGLGNVINESKETMFTSPTFTGTVSGVTKSMVGLGNVDNTTDLNKPISTATQTALDLKANQSTTYTKTEVDTAISAATPTFATILEKPSTISGYGITDAYTKSQVDTNIGTAVSSLVNSAPGTLDTLKELATALGNDDNFSTTVATNIGNVNTSLTNHKNDTANPHSVTKAQVGLGNVDNTSDVNKPISTATQTALDLKAPLASPTFTGTVSGVTKSMVGLGNVDNTADSAKNVLSATKLTTARTIGGVSFDGSANVNLPGVNTTGNQDTSGNASTATNVAWSGVTSKPTLPSSQEGSRYTTDFNSILSTGFFNAESVPTNAPGAYGQMVCARGIDTGLQIYGGYNNDNLWFRGWWNSGNTFSSWRKVLHDGNYNSYSPTLTGTGASGTWGISITGNAATATTANALNTANAYTGTTFTASSGLVSTASSNATAYLGAISASWGGTSYPTLYGSAAERWVMHINPHISYVSNGSNGYTGSMTGSTVRFASDTAASTYWDIGVGTSGVGTDKFSIGRAGTSLVNITNTGNLTAIGNVTAYSDESLKENITTIDNALEKTLALRGVYYNKKSDDTKIRKLGVIAQEIKKIIPEVVLEDNKGLLSVDYGNIVGLLIEAIKEQQKQIDNLTKMLGK